LLRSRARAKATVLHKLIVQGLDDLEDAVLGAEALNRIREGKEKTYSLNEVITEIGLDASDL
jgi:RHH-type rel operon transcriptional repressor/antitoxin RelB